MSGAQDNLTNLAEVAALVPGGTQPRGSGRGKKKPKPKSKPAGPDVELAGDCHLANLMVGLHPMLTGEHELTKHACGSYGKGYLSYPPVETDGVVYPKETFTAPGCNRITIPTRVSWDLVGRMVRQVFPGMYSRESKRITYITLQLVSLGFWARTEKTALFFQRMVYHDTQLFTNTISQASQDIPAILEQPGKAGAEARWRTVFAAEPPAADSPIVTMGLPSDEEWREVAEDLLGVGVSRGR